MIQADGKIHCVLRPEESVVLERLYYPRQGPPRWLSGKEFACNAGDTGSIPRSGRSPGGGNGNPLQHSCLKNPMDREAWQATVHRVTKSQK